jgi:hypothetical protein
MMKQIRGEGCGLWAILALALVGLFAALIIYIDQRFGAETSAFFLGLLLGIPFLLIVVFIVGGIYVLIIRGTTHLQERDDVGEIERLRALRELARTERSATQQEKALLDHQRREQRLLDAWQQQQLPRPDADWGRPPSGASWPDDDEGPDPTSGGPSYRILE